MDINKNEPFKRIVFDIATLIKNTFDYSSFSAEKVEVTGDEFFTRINNLKSDDELIKVLDYLKTEKIINKYWVEKDKTYTGDFGDGKSDLYTLDIDGSELSKFINETSTESSFAGLSNLTGKVLVKNGITLDLKNGTLEFRGSERIDIRTYQKSIRLLAILMANNDLVTFGKIYKELDITPDDTDTEKMNGNLRKVKNGMCKLLEEVGIKNGSIKSMILTKNKIGLIMVDQK